jgi:hypothetical protein
MRKRFFLTMVVLAFAGLFWGVRAQSQALECSTCWKTPPTYAPSGAYPSALTETTVLCFPLLNNRWPPIPYNPVLDPITGADDGSYALTWVEQPAHLANTYALQEASEPSFTEARDVCITAQQVCTVTDNLAGTFYYRVRGQNAWGQSAWSNVQMAEVLLPDAPVLAAIENADEDGIYTVAWDAAARAASYLLEESTDAAFGTRHVVYQGTGRSWSAANRLYGTCYYRVNALGPTGQSVWSNVQAVKVGGAVILANHSTYRRSSSRYVVGEVFNDSSTHLRSLRVAVNFFYHEQLVETDYATLYLDNLHPHEKTCFKITVDDPPAWTHYAFEIPTFRRDGSVRPNLTILNYSGRVRGTTQYRIIGEIRNDEPNHIRAVTAVATMYDGTGRVCDCDNGSINSTDLNPGQVSSFSITASPANPASVAWYTLQTDGTR